MSETETLLAPDGLRLSYRVVGEGEPVVLLHAFTADSRLNWDLPGITQAIVDSGRRAIMLDARGHGDSDAPTDPAGYGWERYAADVVALLDALHLERCVLVGYSLGACTAAWLIPREPRVRAAVLGGIAQESIDQWPQETVDLYVQQLRLQAEAGTPAGQPGVGPLLALDAGIASVRAFTQPVTFRLSEIDVPVLVLNGTDDFPTGPIGDQIPGAVQQIVPGGHVTAPLAPEFARAVVTFLDGLKS